MTTKTYPQTWDMESVFPGGSSSTQLDSHLQQYKERTEQFSAAVQAFQTPQSKGDFDKVHTLLEQATATVKGIREASAFVSCLEAQNNKDTGATILRSRTSSLAAKFGEAQGAFRLKLAATEDSLWSELLKDDRFSRYTFVLNEWRNEANERLSEKEEAMITALGVDGYHAWGQMYNALVSETEVTVTVNGEDKTLSVGQANNLTSHADPAVREEVAKKLEQAWTAKEQLFATTINHLAGFRLATYEKRGWDEVLKDPLSINRMKQETLDAMWSAISKNKAPFADFLQRKAELLGLEKMTWAHLDAPVSASAKTMTYDEGAAFILKHFAKFGPEMAGFAKQAFENGWIEAEDRANKRPGGFCTGLPQSEESRIFMTYSGSMSNVATLAHELGHAFHTYALRPVDYLNRGYAMNVAETASTFAEMIVADAAVKEAGSKDEKIALLEDKVSRSVAFFMNIHSRFLFETRFYELRKNGMVSAEKLNELTLEAQREAYAGAIEEGHPHFWASKMHFHITGVPFYNFPYTFGYLFSLSIYARALEEGTSYEEKYMALLRDTAVMTVEDLAQKHLGEDITSESFWEKGIALCVRDAEEFLSLTK